MKKSGLLITLVLMAASVAYAGTHQKGPTITALPSGYGLETKDQRWVEAMALRLMESPLVKAAQKDVEKTYRDDPTYQLPAAAPLAEAAARELTYRTAQYVITEDPVRPKFLWTYNATRKSHGVQIPGTTFIESVDSIYRVLTIGKGYHYEITGKRPGNGPAFITFEVWNSAQGLQPTVKYVTHLQQDNMEFGADGSFKVLAGPEPADGRKNYLHAPEGGWLLIRQSLSDWSNQAPIENLQVKLLDKVLASGLGEIGKFLNFTSILVYTGQIQQKNRRETKNQLC